jgi:hypothetical protein
VLHCLHNAMRDLLTYNFLKASFFLIVAAICFVVAFVGVRTRVIALPFNASVRLLLNFKTHYRRGYDSVVYWFMVGLWVALGMACIWRACRAF